MKKVLLDLLICPACLPAEIELRNTIIDASGDDILTGELHCHVCQRKYPITDGVADLEPIPYSSETLAANKYETAPVISSYLWSHYGDILNDEYASDAYREWVDLMSPHDGLAIDAGGAVGRFSFEMAQHCDFVVGLDTSRAFIKTARELMKKREMTFALKQEGNITTDVSLTLPGEWTTEKVEFIVANALALPFRKNSAGSLSSLNLIDKVPSPIKHLEEINRVARDTQAQFLLSDPFSWSEEAAKEEEWLGGKTSGSYAGKGIDNVMALLTKERDQFPPAWEIEGHGHVWWKIRTHANHYEQIRSCYMKASR